MAADELIEVKFRLADGTDIGPSKYSSITTVGSLKEKIIKILFFQQIQFHNGPKFHESYKENGPKTINDVKLINAGKILENNKTLAESRSPVSEIPGGVITMLVVLRPPMADKNSEKSQERSARKSTCSCTIL
ncbi:putative Ubiquitin-like domain superfamily, UBL3-like, ubiquitin domain-containing protein [Helianthus annuus]|nr:putative Ubiquitin-like domain superfamily, UBL3-like, ubiquitin domain-containing protein [Helianthus annuus]